MQKIFNSSSDKVRQHDGIFERSENIRKGVNSYTDVSISLKNNGKDLLSTLKSTSKGIGEIHSLSSLNGDDEDDQTLEEMTNSLSDSVLLPPTEAFATIVPPEGENAVNQVSTLITQQLIQQFYEAYSAPTGLKDTYNRLGEIAGQIEDLHTLYPNGVKGLIGKDVNATWNTKLNFAFTVDEGLGTPAAKYSSLGFPPFVGHDTVSLDDYVTNVSSSEDVAENAKTSTYDIPNALYKRGKATYRYPAFKQVNDNINFLQVLLNRCFGIESTYINEWDISMYMQEGIVSYKQVQDGDDIINQPLLVTNLTYGLLDDAPIELFSKTKGDVDLDSIDLNVITPFASANLAVSSRYGIDDSPIGQQANSLNYIIADYPYSAYWLPSASGENHEDLNVANFNDELFAYKDAGEPYSEKYDHFYTPKIFHGEDLSRSSKNLGRIINYADSRYSVLSGWDATDNTGAPLMNAGDFSNENFNTNAYAYLPFWKQFYTTGDDGLSDVDKYLQEIYAADSDVSILDASYEILVNITAADNTTFQNYISNKQNQQLATAANASAADEAVDYNDNGIASNYDSENVSGIKILGCEIPGSKLLKMFLKKNKSTNKATSAASQSADFTDPANAAAASNSGNAASALKNTTASKTLGSPEKTVVNGVETEVTSYTSDNSEDLCNKKSVGDGVAEWSPFLYGGPHGRCYSPLTLEGYTQFGNETLANVPTVDPIQAFRSDLYIPNNSSDAKRLSEYSKNFKHRGSYIDTVTAITPNEREALLSQDSKAIFGMKNIKPNTAHIVNYYSNTYWREAFWEEQRYFTLRILWWTVRIPNIFYFKLWRVLNNSFDRFLGSCQDYGTKRYQTRTYDSRLRYNTSAQTDWTSEAFRLIPCSYNITGWNVGDTNNTWNKDTTVANIKSDETMFTRVASDNYDPETDWDSSRSCRKSGTPKVKYLVSPVQDGYNTICEYVDNKWRHWDTYSSAGSKWYNQLKKLYTAGTRETFVTLPIINAKNNKIADIVCGIASIVKSTAPQWEWRIVKVNHNHVARHGRHGWWIFKTACRHYKCIITYTWKLCRSTRATYNMFFCPEKVKYSIPTNEIIKREVKYNSQRNKSSSNIIERWNIDGKNISSSRVFNTLSKREDKNSPTVFPFCYNFMNKYGKYESYLPLPGVNVGGAHRRYAGDLRILRTKGLFYGDILESFRESGEVKSITGTCKTYDIWDHSHTDTNESSGSRTDVTLTLGKFVFNVQWAVNIFDAFFGKLYEKKSRYQAKSDLRYTSYTADYTASSFAVQQELTDILNSAQQWPAIQVYTDRENKNYMAWYNPIDTINVYIDTATQQIAWLKQLETYADKYLSDKLIHALYVSSTDKRIQSVVASALAGEVYSKHTDSYTEDVNYHDALAIADKAFNTQDPERNSLKTETTARIKCLRALKAYATTLRNNFYKDSSTIHKFVDLVTATRAYLDSAIDSDGVYLGDKLVDYKGNYTVPEINISKDTRFNILKNPGALLWAYINVLYQVRKYWVNMRFNKRAGSYWQMRSLERVLTFIKANSTAEDQVDSALPKGEFLKDSQETTKKSIVFVQTRDSFIEQLENSQTETNRSSLTHAVYVKVNYLGTPTPEKSKKWNSIDNTYNGDEICWVNEAQRWARKPKDGLYYVMSQAITTNLNNSMNLLKQTITLITAKQYKITAEDYESVLQVLKLFETAEWKTESAYEASSGETKNAFSSYSEFETYIKAIAPSGKRVDKAYAAAEELTSLSADVAKIALNIFCNQLMEYKRSYYMNQINNSLYPVYIKWNPKHTWSGITESDTEGAYYIDEWQYRETNGKERTVTDLYGNDHVSSDPISAGITFDVSAAIDAGTLLSSPSVLKDSTLLETLCSSVDKIDLWRIQIPGSIDIPATLLAEKPVLVSAYEIRTTLNGLTNGTVAKSTKSVLAGVATNTVVPILETNESALTINSLSALGKFDSIGDVGLSVDNLVSSGNV